MKPGIYPNMPEDEYHGQLALSASGSKQLLRSLAHFHQSRTEGFTTTPAMLLGKLMHTLVLEPDLFLSRYVVAPNVDKRTEVGKAEWADFQASAGSREVLDEQMHSDARQLALHISTHPAASVVLDGMQAEQSLFWKQHGLLCKARLDISQQGYIADFKTCADASPAGFARACANFGYHRQAAHYMAGYEAVTGEAPAGFLFVCVETSPPYPVGVYELTDADIDLGREQMEIAAQRMHSYLAIDDHASVAAVGYGAQVQKINLPAWAHYQHRDSTNE